MKIFARLLVLSAVCGVSAASAQEPWGVYPLTFSVRALVPTTTETEGGDIVTSAPAIHNNASFLRLMQAPRGYRFGAVFPFPGAGEFEIVVFNPSAPGNTWWVGEGAITGLLGPSVPVLDSPTSDVALHQGLVTYSILAVPPAFGDTGAAAATIAAQATGLMTAQIIVSKSPESFVLLRPAGPGGRTGTHGSTGLLAVADSEENEALAIPTEASMSINFGKALGFVTEMGPDAARTSSVLSGRAPLAPLTFEQFKALARP